MTYAGHVLATDHYAKSDTDPFVLTFHQFWIVGAGSIAFALAGGISPTVPSVSAVRTIGFLALVPTLSAFFVMMVAQRYTTPVRTSLILLLEPVFAAVFAWTVGGEKITPGSAAGGVLIVASMVISGSSRSDATTPTLPREPRGGAHLHCAQEGADAVRRAVKDADPVRVAAIEWLDPVFVAGHWTPQIIELAGGADVLGFAGEHSEQSTWEMVAAARPEVVVVMPCGYDAERSREEGLLYAAELRGIGAKRIVAVDAAAYFSRPGPRLVDGLELMAHVLHPDLVPEAAGAVYEIDV